MRLEKVLQMVNGTKKSGPEKKADVPEKIQNPGRYVQ